MTTIPMLEKELEQAYKDLNYYKNRNEKLNNQLQQKENIIKEVREYCLDKAKGRLERTLYDDILEILNEENK